jgi:hypothetical protein
LKWGFKLTNRLHLLDYHLREGFDKFK